MADDVDHEVTLLGVEQVVTPLLSPVIESKRWQSEIFPESPATGSTDTQLAGEICLPAAFPEPPGSSRASIRGSETGGAEERRTLSPPLLPCPWRRRGAQMCRGGRLGRSRSSAPSCCRQGPQLTTLEERSGDLAGETGPGVDCHRAGRAAQDRVEVISATSGRSLAKRASRQRNSASASRSAARARGGASRRALSPPSSRAARGRGHGRRAAR